MTDTGSTLSFPAAMDTDTETDAARDRCDDTLALLIDGATNYAIYMLDPEGRVSIWNRGAERIKGWGEQEIVGSPAHIFYIPEDVAAGRPAEDLRCARAEGRREEEGWRLHKDGSRFLANLTITALHGRSGELRGYGVVVRDITQQRAAEVALAQRESQLAAILATVPDAMVCLDYDLRIMSFSRTAERMFGRSEREMIGVSVETLLETETKFGKNVFSQVPRLGKRMLGRRGDGSIFPLELAVDAIQNGSQPGFMVFMRDITERERTIAEIQRLQNRLAQAGRASAMGMIGSTLAHELNQPIAAVTNFAEAATDLLASGAPTALVRDALAGAIGEARRAGQIVGRMRGFIARGELERSICDPVALIRQSGAIMCALIEDARVRLRYDFDHGGVMVFVEPIQVQQVVLNLLRNALHAMRAAERRLLTITTRREGDMVRVSVADTGSGMPDEQLQTLFTPFANSTSQGMGIGLSICSAIVDAHGGTIGATSGKDGSCLSFTLPTLMNQRDDDH